MISEEKVNELNVEIDKLEQFIDLSELTGVVKAV